MSSSATAPVYVNQRQTERYKTSIPVGIYVHIEKDKFDLIEGEITNISEGGAHIICNHPFRIKQRLMIEFRLAEAFLIHARVSKTDAKEKKDIRLPAGITPDAVIRWGDSDRGFGVQFVDLDDAKRGYVRKLVRQVQRRGAKTRR
jgi:hypothetical protein